MGVSWHLENGAADVVGAFVGSGVALRDGGCGFSGGSEDGFDVVG